MTIKSLLSFWLKNFNFLSLSFFKKISEKILSANIVEFLISTLVIESHGNVLVTTSIPLSDLKIIQLLTEWLQGLNCLGFQGDSLIHKYHLLSMLPISDHEVV
jgi:hypothetical protein